MHYYFVNAAVWLNPVVYLIGLGVAVWAYLRCRKCGYLVLAVYFALTIFWLVVWPRIQDTINAHRQPDISAQIQQKIEAAQLQATQKVLTAEGYPEGIPHRLNIRFPYGPIFLVLGLWMVARKETPHQPKSVEQ